MGFFTDMMQGFFGKTLGGLCQAIPNCELIVLGFKILIMLFLVAWVRSHLGGGMVATIVMLFVGYLILFHYWWLFGPLAIIYLFIIMGLSQVVMDIAFGGGFYYTEKGHGMEQEFYEKQMLGRIMMKR